MFASKMNYTHSSSFYNEKMSHYKWNFTQKLYEKEESYKIEKWNVY